MKDVVKAAIKGSKPAALEDLVNWLQSTIEKGSYKVKMKCLRIIMMVAAQPEKKAAKVRH